jgi:hypothetical protein
MQQALHISKSDVVQNDRPHLMHLEALVLKPRDQQLVQTVGRHNGNNFSLPHVQQPMQPSEFGGRHNEQYDVSLFKDRKDRKQAGQRQERLQQT